MNQNLLIVDDERRILMGLEELFRYEFDMDIGVYTANSAREALKLLNAVRFDVVLTDIKMPGMDGIALFEKIKENWPRCKTVFLTGYRNFNDIYRVINNHDVKYILKMEEDETIMEAVREFMLQGQRELEEQHERIREKQKREETRKWMQKKYVDNLLKGGFQKETTDTTLEDSGSNFDFRMQALVFLIYVDSDSGEQHDYTEQLAEIIQQNVPDKLNIYCHMLDESNEVALIQAKNGEETDWNQVFVLAAGALEYSQEIFAATCQCTFSAVISARPYDSEEYGKALSGLMEIREDYLTNVQNFIFNEGSLPALEVELEENSCNIGSMLESLHSCLELQKKESYDEILDMCLKKMTERNSRHDPVALETYYSLSTFILRFINENHLNRQVAFKTGTYKLTNVDAHGNWQEAATYLREVSDAVFTLLNSKEDMLSKRALRKVLEYIEEHLDEDLSLTELADIGGFNSSYFSRMFKQVMNETVSEYVLRRRIGLAKRLLADSNVKIQDIAYKTGYTSPQSFARTFRREMGVSPKEYRESNL